jgi:hypothetical protein
MVCNVGQIFHLAAVILYLHYIYAQFGLQHDHLLAQDRPGDNGNLNIKKLKVQMLSDRAEEKLSFRKPLRKETLREIFLQFLPYIGTFISALWRYSI